MKGRDVAVMAFCVCDESITLSCARGKRGGVDKTDDKESSSSGKLCSELISVMLMGIVRNCFVKF